MVSTDSYILTLIKHKKKLELDVSAQDSGHAQAQSVDIARALSAEKYDLKYGIRQQTALSKLFRDLAENNFTHTKCSTWKETFANGSPCVYALGSRQYVRTVILGYLDIPKDGVTAKTKCLCKQCINPYHFTYMSGKNEKISCGDRKLLIAYRSQGVKAAQIAKALNVHRSTIYRHLGNEPISDGPESHRCGG
jgi:hypothetical protein